MMSTTDNKKNTLAKVLTHLMSDHGLTSSELARQTGIAQPVIYRLMTGATENPQILTIKPIADFFKLSIEQLLGYTSLDQQRILNNELLHDVTNKLVSIKTISTILIEILPKLIEGYKKAADSKLILETTSLEVLPLLEINAINLLKAANSIQELFFKYDRKPEGVL